MYETETAARVSKLTTAVLNEVRALDKASNDAEELTDVLTRACAYRDNVLGAMSALRESVDELETLTAKKYWPYPNYGDLLFSVK